MKFYFQNYVRVMSVKSESNVGQNFKGHIQVTFSDDPD